MKANYRPEIDGLRSVAVVAVIIYRTKIFISGDDHPSILGTKLINNLIIKELN